jgi:hypothetical protein
VQEKDLGLFAFDRQRGVQVCETQKPIGVSEFSVATRTVRSIQSAESSDQK